MPRFSVGSSPDHVTRTPLSVGRQPPNYPSHVGRGRLTAWKWADIRQFLADGRALLEAEAAKLPAPDMNARRRGVLDMLAGNPAIRYAYTVTDTRADPVVLTLAIRDKGTIELGISREKFDALGLPGLIGRLVRSGEPK